MSTKWKKKPDGNKKASNKCICGQEKSGLLIKCEIKDCSSPFWHSDCAGLEGATKTSMKNIKWKCPCCIFNKFNDRFESDGLSLDCKRLKDEITAELKSCIPEFIVAAENHKNSVSTCSHVHEPEPQVKHTLVIKPNANDS